MKKNILFILIVLVLILAIYIVFSAIKSTNKKRISEYRSFLEQKNLPVDDRIEAAEKYLNLSNELKNTDGMIDAYLCLGNCYHSQFDYTKASEYFLKGWLLAKDKEPDHIVADISYKIAGNYLDIGDYIRAYEFVLKTDSIDRKNKKKGRSAETLNLLGSIYEKTGLYVKSLATHYESFELQKRKNNLKGIGNSYHNLAHIYLLGKRNDKAYSYYSKALEIYLQLLDNKADSANIHIGIAKIQLSMGNFYIGQNDSANALNYLNQALVAFNNANSKVNIAQALFYTGNLYFQWKDYLKAREYYLRSLDLNTSENNKIGIVLANLNLGRIYYFNKDANKAIETLRNSLRTATEIGAKRNMAEVSELLYYIYSELPDSVEQTIKYATLFLKTKKYLPNENMRDSIIQMSVKHEVTLQKNEEIAIEKYKKDTRTVLLISILIVVIIVAAFVYYKSREKQRRTYEKKLAEEQIARFKEVYNAIENERKRIAVDLHDSLGQMLSTTKLYLSGLEEFVEEQNENNRNLYANTINLLDESCGELRNISYNIMPGSFIKYGLVVAIEEIINKINDRNKIRIDFKFKGFEKRQNENIEIAIYRIIQEVLNNTLKHANATLVTLNLIKENKILALSINDNGKGMEDIELYKNKGLGWKSIFSRVQMLNGKIEVKTANNKGTRIDILVPV